MKISDFITVGYWSTKGLGSACRQIILYSGNRLKSKNYKLLPIIQNESVTYNGSEWSDGDKIKLKKINSLINLPYIQLLDSNKENILITQSNACLSYLGRKFNMFGSSDIEKIQIEQLLLESNDLRNVITTFAYTHFQNEELELRAAKDVFNRAFQHDNSGKMQKFELWLNINKSNFLTKNISSADFNLFDVLDFYIEFLKYYKFSEEKGGKNLFDQLGFPNLGKFYQNFITLPNMQKYLNSELYKLPYTNKSANFGSGIKGYKWDPENQIDRTPQEIIIN